LNKKEKGIIMDDVVFSQIDFGLLQPLLENDDITDISYSNGGQLWVKTLTKGVHPEKIEGLTNEVMEKLAFQCSNVMGKTFNMAHPFLDAESAELRLNFVHDSIATNGIAVLIRKTPAKIRLNQEKLVKEDYVSLKLLDFLITCVKGHCNILVSGETGSGKTELVKYLASNTKEDEKIITIEDTLELHLDKIYPNRDIVAMKTNNIASYSEVLVTCMRQNPKWILLSEVRSAEAVMAVRNSISSGHNIISTIHSDKASSIPMRLYSLLESSQDIDQFVRSMHRYIQLGIHVKGYFSKKYNRFQREIVQVVEFYVDDALNEAKINILYEKDLVGNEKYNNPTSHLIDYLAAQGVMMREDPFIPKGSEIKANETIQEDKPVIQNQNSDMEILEI
jgi:pilus assembly protein CpaF